MNKKKLANVLIENEWYSRTLNFIAKAYNIKDEELERYIKGNKPVITEELLKRYEEKVEELAADEKEETAKVADEKEETAKEEE